jgi:LacI family transcriptional regulator
MDNNNEINKKTRLKDIAEKAGVSLGTIDRVVHGRSGVSSKSKAKVEKILSEMNYLPNRYASALSRKSVFTIVCVIPRHNPGDYWDDVEQGFQRVIRKYADFKVQLHILSYDQYNYYTFAQCIQDVFALDPQGVVLDPAVDIYTNDLVQKLQEKKIPFVYIDTLNRIGNPLAFYGLDPIRSGYFTAKMLMMGNVNNEPVLLFRKSNEGTNTNSQQECRRKGFLQYMAQNAKDCKLFTLDLKMQYPEEDRQLIEQICAKHPEIHYGAFFNSMVYVVADYLRYKDMHNFHLIGYDLLERNKCALREGYVDFLIAQSPELQSWKSVQALCDYLLFNIRPKEINYMPIDFITSETLDYYEQRDLLSLNSAI